jgi:glycoside/pentoside/hexuronide:cation symporter, GPH family
MSSPTTSPGDPSRAASESLSMRLAAFWGLGAFATTTMLNGIGIVLLYYLVNFVKVEPVVAGALLFASKLFDAFIDPPIGLLSDRTRSRFGRRRPWLLAAAPFCALAFAMLFNVPADASPGTVYVFVSAWLLVYTVAYAAFTVPYLAMPGDFTDDYHERSRLMSWRTVWMTVGNLVGSAGANGLVAFLGNDRAAYGDMGIILGGVIGAAMALTFAGTGGGRMLPVDTRTVSVAEHLRLLRRNEPLLVLMATKIVLYAGLAAFTAVLLFFFSSVLKKTPAQVGLFFGVFSLSTVFFTPVQLWIARRVDKCRAYLVCMGAYAVGILSWLAAQGGEPDWALVLRALWLGAFNAGLFLYGYSMLVDTYAWDYRQTGLRREGFLASAISFVEKFSLAVGPLVIGALLSAMGFDKNLPPTADQSPGAVQAMVLGFVWVPFVAQLVAMLLLRRYRLRREDLEPGDQAARPVASAQPVPAAR